MYPVPEQHPPASPVDRTIFVSDPRMVDRVKVAIIVLDDGVVARPNERVAEVCGRLQNRRRRLLIVTLERLATRHAQ